MLFKPYSQLGFAGLGLGHSLKHVAAAVAALVVCRMLTQRTLVEPERAA